VATVGFAGTKNLDANLTVTSTTSTIELGTLLAELRQENIVLRHSQIVDFVQQTKSAKRKEIASIIGYDAISDFRNLIQSTSTSLQRDARYPLLLRELL
jgi:hypothetical protein